MSNLDRRIRIAVAGLKGEARVSAILALRTNPLLLRSAIYRHLRGRTAQVRAKARHKRLDTRIVSFCVRMTAEEYIKLREDAKRSGTTMSELIRWSIPAVRCPGDH